jgi:hypothetical protein
MKRASLIFVALVLCACTGSDMDHTRCNDTTLGTDISPDGKYIATSYHRSCAKGTGKYTGVKVEEVPPHFWSRRGEIGHVMTIRDFHPITARWTDSRQLEVITPGLKQQNPDESAAFPPKSNWKDVSISYKEIK